ncbi:MAG: hypothetical protein M3308_07895 [Actinomycetota bacterium]|nr:hypothetical protein [Actinomycetota bacterium]
MGFQKSVTCPEQQLYAARSYSLICELRDGVGRPWWAKVAGAVRSSLVVVPDGCREHSMQVPLVEDKHVVGEFGSQGADESFGETVHPGAARRGPDHADATIGQDSIEGCGETGRLGLG